MRQLTKDYLVSKYKKIKILHQNGNNKIVLAEDTDTGCLYVVKFSDGARLPYSQVKSLRHRALPRIIHVAEENGQTISVEEYINAPNLDKLIREKGHLPEKLVLDIALQLCDGLKMLHGKGIIHRDIKPANILLASDGLIKLIDFDAARVGKDEAGQDTRRLGTQGFAPPEQYGFSQTDARSDIYALGGTLKALLGADYRGSLSPVIKKCTQFDPADRYQNIDELAQALEKSKNRRPICAAFAALLILLPLSAFFYIYLYAK